MRQSIRSNTPHRHPRPDLVPGSVRQPARRAGAERAHPEQAVLVAVLLPDTKADLQHPLAELASLARSAGTEVVDTMMQKRMRLSPSHGLGKGRLQELVERVQSCDADVVIFDNDLSPRQIRGLEKAVERKVIDRSELILDIFALRARTREAQLQVELAQLEYTAPRLRGMWTHLERIAGAGGGTAAGSVGGVGTRGPGERQIEVDRRVVKNRIVRLKREIQEIAQRRQREVQARSDQFNVSLVGYTNSGKSTLMNRLTGAQQNTADQLFATLDTKTVRWNLSEPRSPGSSRGHTHALLSDTVGFVRDIPHHLVASFRATLEEAIHADLLVHVVDISSPNAWQQMESVDTVLAELGCETIPQITVLNKADIPDHGAMTEMLARHRDQVLEISALTGAGVERLIEAVLVRTRNDMTDVTVRIPSSAGRLLAEIDRVADVSDRRYLPEDTELDLHIHKAQLQRLLGRYDTLTVVSGDEDPTGGDGRDHVA